MRATINNSFHNSSKNVNLQLGKNVISARRLKTWKKALCCSDCCCSDSSGIRGDDNTPAIEMNGTDAVVTEFEFDQDQRTGEVFLSIYVEKRADVDARDDAYFNMD